jgi:hypothetical protein
LKTGSCFMPRLPWTTSLLLVLPTVAGMAGAPHPAFADVMGSC